MPARSRIRLPHAAALTLAALLATPLGAAAHALLAKSDPARRAVLSKPPAQVRLWFNERLEPAFSSLSVHDAAGNPVTTASAQVAPEDPKRLQLALPSLPAGTYTVRYQVLSVDGHTVNSSFTFTIRPAAALRPHKTSARKGSGSPLSGASHASPASGEIAAVLALR